MQLLKIENIPIQYRFQIESARLEMKQSDNPQMQQSRTAARLNLHKKDIQVRLDTTEMRNSINLKSTATMMADEAAKGKQAVQSAISDMASFGEQVSQIQNGVTIAQLVSQKLFHQPDTITTFLPSVGPDISWEPASVNVDYQAGSIETDWEIDQNVLDYVPGKFQMIIEQYPQVKIEYLGKPHYVPASADPNYEEPVA